MESAGRRTPTETFGPRLAASCGEASWNTRTLRRPSFPPLSFATNVPSRWTVARTLRSGRPSRKRCSRTRWRGAATGGVIVPRTLKESPRSTNESLPAFSALSTESVSCGFGGAGGAGGGRHRRGHRVLRRGGGGEGQREGGDEGEERSGHVGTIRDRLATGRVMSRQTAAAPSIATGVHAPQSSATPRARPLLSACSTMQGSSESVHT